MASSGKSWLGCIGDGIPSLEGDPEGGSPFIKLLIVRLEIFLIVCNIILVTKYPEVSPLMNMNNKLVSTNAN